MRVSDRVMIFSFASLTLYLEPETCATCMGRGFILVPIEGFVNVPNDVGVQTGSAAQSALPAAANDQSVSGAAVTGGQSDGSAVVTGPPAITQSSISLPPVVPLAPVVTAVPLPPVLAPLPTPAVTQASIPANTGTSAVIPAPSQVMPGFHYLGPNYPAPAPTAAVFTTDNGAYPEMITSYIYSRA